MTLLFAIEKDHYRKPQAVKMWETTDDRVPSPNSYIHHTTPALQVQGTLRKRRQKDWKGQKTGKPAVKLNLLKMTGKLHL